MINDIVILSLSDLHIKELKKDPNSETIRNTFVKKIADIVKIDENWRPDFICISGDIAFSGKKEQYDIAKRYIKKLQKLESEDNVIDDNHVIMVAGNHDIAVPEHFKHIKQETKTLAEICGRKKYVHYAKSYFNNINGYFNGEEQASLPPELETAYTNYSNFRKEFIKDENSYRSMDLFKNSTIPYLTGYQVFDDCQVVFLELNNTWYSLPESKDIRKNEYVRFFEKVINNQFIEQIKDLKNQNYMIITLFHHPFYLLNPLEYQSAGIDSCLYDALVELSDICFTGHTHGPEGKTPDFLGHRCQYILNGAFYDKNPDTKKKIVEHEQAKHPVPDCSATLIRIDVVNNTLERKHIYCNPRKKIEWETMDKPSITLNYNLNKEKKAKEYVLKHKLIKQKNYNSGNPDDQEYHDNLQICTEIFGKNKFVLQKEGLNYVLKFSEQLDYPICFIDMGEEEEITIPRLDELLSERRQGGVPLIVLCKSSDGDNSAQRKYNGLKNYYTTCIMKGDMVCSLSIIKKK